MALSRHDLIRLLESLRSADGLELVREVAERLLQELIDAEVTAKIGAEWSEHTDTRTTCRNGHRGKTVTTQAGAQENVLVLKTQGWRPEFDGRWRTRQIKKASARWCRGTPLG